MALQGWYVKKVERKDIQLFIEKWHYSKSINGCISDYCYGLYDNENILKGAMFFGRMAMANQWRRFSDTPENVIELRRLCCIDDTPRNAESFFISRALKLLKTDWKKGGLVVSYSDLEYDHIGTIYKASNFKMVGKIPGAKVILYNEKLYHDKTIRTKYKGVLKPFAKKIKDALLSGEAIYKTTKGKMTYLYQL